MEFNIISLSLFRRYGHDADNERVFFYRANVEVNFLKIKKKIRHMKN